jgi:hypothetical protein
MSTTNLETEWGPTIAYSRLCGLVDALDEATTGMQRVLADLLSGKAPSSERLAEITAAIEAVSKAREANREAKAWALSTPTSQEEP